jgi:cell division protein ZapE
MGTDFYMTQTSGTRTAIDLSALRGAIQAPTRGDELIPPPRFATKSFQDYRIDSSITGQAEAVQRVQDFAAWKRPFLGFMRRSPGRPGLYLDGGFGVGKTHLLAAAFHAAPGTKRFLSFAEAISLVILLGGTAATDLLAADLVCIDEFELDDPANTRLADLLLEALADRGTRIITTSNTIPGELGKGRFSADQFRNQLARIADRFEDVHVPGTDHRRVVAAADGTTPGWNDHVEAFPDGSVNTVLDQTSLDQLLINIPIANVRRLASRMLQVTITDFRPFTDQLAALRFVTFIDRCYEQCTRLRVRSTIAIDAIFPEEHCMSAFAKKYRRCQSRLQEMCST